MSDAESAIGAESTAPLLRIVKGNPSDEEIAVLVTLVAAASGPGGDHASSAEPRNEWGRPEDMFRPQWGGPGSFPNLRF
ncbi:acyl-CoA carboxylase subunit epsilon [Gordonia sp. NPDC003424]